MSYILDALRKADAERDRGNVPGIHAQPSFGSAMPARSQSAAKPWPWLAAGALAVVLVAALAWYLLGGAPRHAAEAVVPMAISPAQAPAPAPVPAPVAAAPAPVAPTQQAAVPQSAPKPEPAPVARKPKPAAPAASGAAPVDVKPAATGERVYAIAELPDDIRRQLPNVNVGGSMYSAKAADRILIINGQVLHEGDRIAPDLVLQQIRLKGALLNFKGYRYAVTF